MTFINGIAYGPARSTDKYCKDWFTVEYQDCWGSGSGCRGDLQTMKSLGFNLVRTYWVDANNNHTAFLNEAERVGIGIEIGIANSYVAARDTASVTKLINETKGRSCVKVYTVSNEAPMSQASNIAFMINHIRNLGVQQAIMVSTIFDANFTTAKTVLSAIQNRSNLLCGVNMYFYSNPPQQHGDCLTGAVKQWVNDPNTFGVPLCVSEWGCPSTIPGWQTSIQTQIDALKKLKNITRFNGAEVFSFQSESWKGSSGGEDSYGVLYDAYGNKRPTFSLFG